jgi:hypothetical protein
MEYKDERSADLRLHLFRGPLELEAFPVVARGGRRIGDVEIDACIIGASHTVQFRIGAETVTEVLACRAEAADRFGDRLLGVWRLEEEVGVEIASGMDYSFSGELTPLAQAHGLLAELREQISAGAGEESIVLAFRFPSMSSQTPETLLRVSADGDGLSIRSAHVYPGEDLTVFSTTRLTFEKGLCLEPAAQLLEVASS